MNNHKEFIIALDDRSDHDDFDQLLEESSLGSAAARKNQEDTPDEVYQRVETNLRNSDATCRHIDVDDFLLRLVHVYSVSNDAEPPSFQVLRHGFRWCWDRSDGSPENSNESCRRERQENPFHNVVKFAFHVHPDLTLDIVQNLLDEKVFSYLRQDVARSMVALCFNSRRPLPLVILNACASAVPASSFRDELAEAFTKIMPTVPTALPAGSWLKRIELEPASSTSTNLVALDRFHDIAIPRPEQFRRSPTSRSATWQAIVYQYNKFVSTTASSYTTTGKTVGGRQATWKWLGRDTPRAICAERLPAWWLVVTLCRQSQTVLSDPPADYLRTNAHLTYITEIPSERAPIWTRTFQQLRDRLNKLELIDTDTLIVILSQKAGADDHQYTNASVALFRMDVEILHNLRKCELTSSDSQQHQTLVLSRPGMPPQGIGRIIYVLAQNPHKVHVNHHALEDLNPTKEPTLKTACVVSSLNRFVGHQMRHRVERKYHHVYSTALTTASTDSTASARPTMWSSEDECLATDTDGSMTRIWNISQVSLRSAPYAPPTLYCDVPILRKAAELAGLLEVEFDGEQGGFIWWHEYDLNDVAATGIMDYLYWTRAGCAFTNSQG